MDLSARTPGTKISFIIQIFCLGALSANSCHHCYCASCVLWGDGVEKEQTHFLHNQGTRNKYFARALMLSRQLLGSCCHCYCASCVLQDEDAKREQIHFLHNQGTRDKVKPFPSFLHAPSASVLQDWPVSTVSRETCQKDEKDKGDKTPSSQHQIHSG